MFWAHWLMYVLLYNPMYNNCEVGEQEYKTMGYINLGMGCLKQIKSGR